MRKDSPASKTALMVAGYRALATERREPLFQDPWAQALAGDEGIALANAFTPHFAHMELWIAVRTAFMDRQLQHCVDSEGFTQVVLLGAGLDTRAARLARPCLRFFEVDHPATQADKQERLARLDGYPREAIGFAPCDFESNQDLISSLTDAGLDASIPALVIWEGVTPYLHEEAVLATATRLAGGLHPRSVLIFDYVSKRLAHSDAIGSEDQGVKDRVSEMGEPIRWGTDAPLSLLHEAGYQQVRTIDFDEACLSLTGSYDRSRQFRFQGMALASKSTWLRA